ncbi:MAG: PAS domain S-box protein, partial [Cyanobacteria bacterium J069]
MPTACASAETGASADPDAPICPPAAYEPRLQQVLDALPVCISYANAQQRYCFMNHTYEVWMERRREELYGKLVQEVIGDAAYQLAAPFIEQALKGQSVHYEAALPYETGKTRQVSVLLVPDWNADQQVQGYYALVTDISDRKALEQTSQQTSLQLQKVLHSACASVVSFRLYANVEITWGYDYRSPGAEALFGYTAEELMADPLLWLSRVLPEDRQSVIVPAQTQLLQGQSVTFEYRFRHQDGSIRWISSVASSTYVPPEHCWRITAVDIDITQRKRTEDALQQSQDRLKTAQSVAQIGNWEFDLVTQKITWSDQMFAIYGQYPELGEPSYLELLQKFVPEDRVRLETAVSNAIRLGKPYVLDMRLIQPDSQIVYLELRGQAQLDPEGHAIRLYGTTQNITERKRLELALKQRSQRESALNQVIQSIRNSLDLPTIFESAVQETADLLRLIRVSIMQYRPAQQCWRLRAEYVPPDRPSLKRQGLTIPHENNPLGAQIARGEIVRLDDNRQAPGAMNQALASQLPGRWLLVPLKIGKTIWGSLSLTREIAHDPWQDWEVELAQAVA